MHRRAACEHVLQFTSEYLPMWILFCHASMRKRYNMATMMESVHRKRMSGVGCLELPLLIVEGLFGRPSSTFFKVIFVKPISCSHQPRVYTWHEAPCLLACLQDGLTATVVGVLGLLPCKLDVLSDSRIFC